ncbi:ParB family protein [Aggregatibacter actinomycetemcomitans]|uniref:ParB family protein n=1 Tax=Aggregatibacter actinomycetemcomitans TaxID=714 RepID=UPI00197C36DF|nr:ParB family protein [Aggregatibacter actinomycetemcomitans]MBN6058638.1 ParB N-terminal domain-containing protein [Aggregatibacter actinomycetemcomitans]MBN6087147.1 ParB N-terminal domain-containing protein [Aggregatibacter actinomycetemcomitans]
MNNPFTTPSSKKNKAQLDAIAKGLNVQPISNTSSTYQAATATSYPTQAQYITVTLDKLRPYEHNPRKTRNPNFEMIKESIRRRGLDHKPNITQRPGEPYYIIADGGNTRIQALKELFTETQDQRFWSIECLYKPWKGDSADSVEAELDLLIGHLIENDTRADLSFIEKALGIQQAKEYYEKKLGKELSSREISTELEKGGYIIHYTNVSKMERCVTFLYPYIPDVLLNGLGHAPIDKLLAIRNNALSVWQNYQFNTDIQFDDIWQNSLSRCNEDNPFNIKDFQHNLINEMMDILGDSENSPTYELLYLEIDLDEQRFKKLAQKQQEITASVDQSLQDIADFNQPSSIPEQVIPTSKPLAPSQASGLYKHNSEHAVSAAMTTESVTKEEDNTTDNTEDWLPSLVGVEQVESKPVTETQTVLDEFSVNLEKQFGISPGTSIQEQRQQRAQANGLTFACVGRQPVDDIWQIYPGRQHKIEAYSLALDIAESAGLESYVEHVVKEPVDYSYRMRPLDIKSPESKIRFYYDLLTLLQTDDIEHLPDLSVHLNPMLGTEDMDDVTLVKVFRLIRLVRYMRQGASHDNV